MTIPPSKIRLKLTGETSSSQIGHEYFPMLCSMPSLPRLISRFDVYTISQHGSAGREGRSAFAQLGFGGRDVLPQQQEVDALLVMPRSACAAIRLLRGV
jgi:hypothetical protein